MTMETDDEWEFVKNRSQTERPPLERLWNIGLYRNESTRIWTWVNGKPLTIEKWRVSETSDAWRRYASLKDGLIHKFRPYNLAGYICEEIRKGKSTRNASINPFTRKSDEFQLSPAALPEI